MLGRMIGGGGYQSARDGMPGPLGSAINPTQKPMMPGMQPQTQPPGLGGLFGAMQGGRGMMGGFPFGMGGMGQGGQGDMLQRFLSKFMGGGMR